MGERYLRLLLGMVMIWFSVVSRGSEDRPYNTSILSKMQHGYECWWDGCVRIACRTWHVLACVLFCVLWRWWAPDWSCLLLGRGETKAVLSTALEWIAEAPMCWLWRGTISLPLPACFITFFSVRKFCHSFQVRNISFLLLVFDNLMFQHK